MEELIREMQSAPAGPRSALGARYPEEEHRSMPFEPVSSWSSAASDVGSKVCGRWCFVLSRVSSRDRFSWFGLLCVLFRRISTSSCTIRRERKGKLRQRPQFSKRRFSTRTYWSTGRQWTPFGCSERFPSERKRCLLQGRNLSRPRRRRAGHQNPLHRRLQPAMRPARRPVGNRTWR